MKPPYASSSRGNCQGSGNEIGSQVTVKAGEAGPEPASFKRLLGLTLTCPQ